MPDSTLLDEYLDQRFNGRQYIYTHNGRTAINYALKFYDLNREDVVTILTTTGNFYISGCVTKEIEKFCKWSRQFEQETKLIFVNHEFGYPYPDLGSLRKFNLPIIEDCASSFFSKDPDSDTGNVGDFVIYSFPKMFPLQIGGLLVNNTANRITDRELITREELRHLKNVVSFYISDREGIIGKRLTNHEILSNKFRKLGFNERFQPDEGSVPGVYMFRTGDQTVNLNELKEFYYAHGVQCSVFYGEDSFFLPVHQGLGADDLQYFYEVMCSFLIRADCKQSHTNK